MQPKLNTMKRSIIFIALLLFFCSARAAEAEASLAAFNKTASASNAALFFSALEEEEFLDEPIVIRENMSHDSLCALVWYWAGEYYYDAQDFQLSAHYGQRALPLCEAIGDKTMEADCASLLGLVYVRLGAFDKAAVYAKRCNKLDIESGDPNNIASSYNTLAGIYMSMRQPDEAEKYILQAIDYIEETDNWPRKAVIYGMASEVYQHKGKPQLTLEYATRAWEIENKLGRADKAAIRQTQRAAALIVMERYGEAEKALTEAIPVIEASGNYHSLAIAYNQMGDLLYVTGRNREGADYYYKALPIFMAQHDIYNEAHTRKGLRETLRGIDPEAALEHGDRFEHLRDSIYDRETNANLSQFAAEMENDILQQINRKQRIRTTFTIAVICVFFVILTIISYLVYIRRHKKQVEHFNELLMEVEKLRRAERVKQMVGNSEKAQADKDEAAQIADGDDELLLARVVEYVTSHLNTGDLNVDDVAESLCMSVSTFRRRMLAATNGSPKTFIRVIQINKAKDLLSASSLSVKEIAMQCGYKETNSFIRAFQHDTGMTPAKWREQSKTAAD